MFGQLELFKQIKQLRVGNVGLLYLLSSYKWTLHVIGGLGILEVLDKIKESATRTSIASKDISMIIL